MPDVRDQRERRGERSSDGRNLAAESAGGGLRGRITTRPLALRDRWAAAVAPRWRIEVVRRPEGAKGFVLLPRRWVVKRTFGRPMRRRRLGRDHERRPDGSETMAPLSAMRLMPRRRKPSDADPPLRRRRAA